MIVLMLVVEVVEKRRDVGYIVEGELVGMVMDWMWEMRKDKVRFFEMRKILCIFYNGFGRRVLLFYLFYVVLFCIVIYFCI